MVEEIVMPDDLLPSFGKVLFDHQCWAWGKDITRAEGNLLLEYGFDRIPGKNKGMTQYTVALNGRPDLFLSVWGFGFYVGDHQDGIFMGRSRFEPMYASGYIELHDKADQYLFRTKSGNLPLLLKGLAEIARYEEWIAGRFPPSYRVNCFLDFPRPLIGGHLPDHWWSFKQRLEESNGHLVLS